MATNPAAMATDGSPGRMDELTVVAARAGIVADGPMIKIAVAQG